MNLTHLLLTIAVVGLYFAMSDKMKQKYPGTILFINCSLAFALAGLFGMLKAVTNSKFRFKE